MSLEHAKEWVAQYNQEMASRAKLGQFESWAKRVERWASQFSVSLLGSWETMSDDMTGSPFVCAFRFSEGTTHLSEEQRYAAVHVGIVIEPQRIRALHDGDAYT